MNLISVHDIGRWVLCLLLKELSNSLLLRGRREDQHTKSNQVPPTLPSLLHPKERGEGKKEGSGAGDRHIGVRWGKA